MAFKINVSNKGKTYKLEVEAEALIGIKIGDKVSGKDVDTSLEGYELEITGTSDKAGFPGFKNLKGSGLRKVLVTYGPGMKNRPRKEGKKPTPNTGGLRLRKTFRGNEISLDTVQININVIKPGKEKFDDLVKPAAPEGEAATEEAPAESAEKPTEAPKEEKKEEPKVKEKKEEVKVEKPAEEKKE